AFWLHDASESAQLQAESAVRRRQAEGLMAIGRELAAFRDPSSGLDRILDQACHLFGMDLCAWGLMDESALRLTWQAARGVGSDCVCGAVQPLADLLMGQVLRSGRPFITHNLTAQGAAPGQPLFADPPMGTAMAVAFRLQGALSGVLLGASTRVLALTDNDMHLFAHLGSYMATAAENAELLAQVQHLAVLEERQRLAREMHDSFGQMLTYLGLRHYLIERAAQAGEMPTILKETANLKQVLQDAHAEIRQNIFRLKESGQPRASWTDRWRQILLEFEARTGTRTQFDLGDDVPGRLPEQVDLQLTRILQEALTNIANHAAALCVTVRLACEEGTLRIAIADDGCGFEPAQAQGPKQQHFGLTIMQERAGALNARLQIRSMRGYGTTISIQLPLGER
ncbi:MAG TPA: GAF domain-containing sensor histidine kinase, partial [Symbiobacteriaceae bacterium]|nr:GAF domain-containing sensor histidine kinase [Symbiobacteriaceae bacterium]